MPVISIITQHIGLAEEIKGDKNQQKTTKDAIQYKCQIKEFSMVMIDD